LNGEPILRHGFTRWELLNVVPIIDVLVVMLVLPALKNNYRLVAEMLKIDASFKWAWQGFGPPSTTMGKYRQKWAKD
jgi:hypothetical protein